MIYFTEKMLQAYFVEFIVEQGEIINQTGTQERAGCKRAAYLQIDTCTVSSSQSH